MTVHIICVIKDSKADVFGTPMVFASKGVAVRSFSNEINSKNDSSLISKHPEDFSLYQIGVYDDVFATFEPLHENGKPELLMSGANCLVK